MLARFLRTPLLEALADTPVVMLAGARQVGKSTLAQTAITETEATYFTLDDAATLAAAVVDPTGFVGGLPDRTIIDEIQRAPALMLALKAAVDANRRPGRFLLTGSANVLTVPKVADSLAGRMEVLQLWPFSQGEILRQQETFLETLFSGKAFKGMAPDEDELRSRIVAGGYPEAVARTSSRRRNAWFNSYLSTIVQRDIRDLANITGLHELPRLLRFLAERSSTLLNMAGLAREAAIPQSTLSRYLTLFEATFLLRYLPAWSTSGTKRLTRAPKPFLTDTGLMASLLGIDEARLATDRTLFGRLLECFVVLEIFKQLSYSETAAMPYHYRTYTGHEIDMLLERADGTVAGVEIKATASPTAAFFKTMRELRDELGDRFRRGVLLYLGSEVVPFGDRLEAVPLPALWGT